MPQAVNASCARKGSENVSARSAELRMEVPVRKRFDTVGCGEVGIGEVSDAPIQMQLGTIDLASYAADIMVDRSRIRQQAKRAHIRASADADKPIKDPT